MALGDCEQNFSNTFGIAVVPDTNGKRYPDLPVIRSPVGNTLIDELGVGNNDDDVVVGLYPGATPPQKMAKNRSQKEYV
jgi:hypothetical protein